jgi:hypothetical protein
MRLTIHGSELKRYSVPVRCTSHISIPQNSVLVFAIDPRDAKEAAIEKLVDKYLRHQNKRTFWTTVGEPQEV